MKRFLVLLVMFGSAVIVRATQSDHIEDPAGLLLVADATQLDGQLEQLQKDTGIRAVLRFHEHMPSPEEDNAPGVYMRGLSAQLGLIDDGVLAVYFADEKEWRVWIGNNLASRFAGRAGTADELTKSGAMHEAKEAWLEKVFAAAEEAWERWSQTAGAKPKPEDKVRFEAAAMVEGLVWKFAP